MVLQTQGDTNVELYGVGGEGGGSYFTGVVFWVVCFILLSVSFYFSCFSGDNMETQNVFLTVQQELVIHYI